MTDRAWPNFIAPPLSWPSTENSCSAVRACSSAATASAGRPPTRFPTPRAARPACPRGRPTSLAVRAIEPRGMSVTRPLSPTRTHSRDAPSTGGASRPPSSRPISVEIPPSEVSPRRVASTVTVATARGQHGGAGRHRPGPGRPGWPGHAGPAQRRQAVRPGSTSGPDDHAGRSPSTTGRCGMPRACHGAPGPRRGPPLGDDDDHGRRPASPAGQGQLGAVGRVPPPAHRHLAPAQLGDAPRRRAAPSRRRPRAPSTATPLAHRPRRSHPAARRGPAGGRPQGGDVERPRSPWDRGRSARDSVAQALPRMRLRLVPHTGHTPLAIRRPFSETTTLPSASRFSLHFTQ